MHFFKLYFALPASPDSTPLKPTFTHAFIPTKRKFLFFILKAHEPKKKSKC